MWQELKDPHVYGFILMIIFCALGGWRMSVAITQLTGG